MKSKFVQEKNTGLIYFRKLFSRFCLFIFGNDLFKFVVANLDTAYPPGAASLRPPENHQHADPAFGSTPAFQAIDRTAAITCRNSDLPSPLLRHGLCKIYFRLCRQPHQRHPRGNVLLEFQRIDLVERVVGGMVPVKVIGGILRQCDRRRG